MKKTLLSTLLFMISIAIFGQVGINTTNPQGIFNVDGAKNNPATGTPTAADTKDDFAVLADGSVGIGTTAPSASAMLDITSTNKGFLAPRVALTSNTDATTIAAPATGLLVFNTGTAGLTYVGYIFWNGTEWRTLSGASLAAGTIGAITCNSATLTPSSYTSGTPYSGTLSVPYTGGNGGTYDAQIIGPVNGLTATLPAGNFAVGSGVLNYTVLGNPTVTSPVTTTFTINIGGKTCNATVGTGEDVKAGELVYYRTGGITSSIGGGGTYGNTAVYWLNNYQTDLPVIGGKLRLDGYFYQPVVGSGTVSFTPRLVNVSTSNVRFYFSALTTVNSFNTANIVLTPNSWTNLDDGIYNGYGVNNTTSSPTATPNAAVAPNGAGTNNVAENNTEVVQVDLSVDDKWYRIYYYPIIDNMNTTSTADDLRRIFISIQRLY